MKKEITHFALCLNNEGYPASLEVGKLYRGIKNKDAEAEGYIQVIDKSGVDYAFTSNRFPVVELPANVEQTLLTNAAGTLSLAEKTRGIFTTVVTIRVPA